MRVWIGIATLLGLALATGFQVTGSVTYQARAPLGTWTGTNPTLKGQVDWDPGKNLLRGQVCLDLQAFDSKEPLRDKHTREMFAVDRYPQACLKVTGWDPGRGVVLGVMSLHGVDRKVEVSVRHSLEGSTLRFRAEMEVLLSDYGLKAPSFMGMRVQDRVLVRVEGQGVTR
ncbi:YceI family protein [Thermus albus]|uniref:YceI family protein n=1 Tax=Thermus albus TaxID=2908146 RepID=UPI001FAB32C3|nr:YceI family protein [Thermus albus]